MTTTVLLRDAYRELDESGSLSVRTRESLQNAGIDPDLLDTANNASKETEED